MPSPEKPPPRAPQENNDKAPPKPTIIAMLRVYVGDEQLTLGADGGNPVRAVDRCRQVPAFVSGAAQRNATDKRLKFIRNGSPSSQICEARRCYHG